MKKTNKLLVGLLVLGTTMNGAFAKDFPDVPKSHWAYSQINILSDEFVIVGYPDGTFKPDENTSRAEFATMVIKALQQENSPLTETFEFSDVPYSHWAYNTIQRAIAFDLLKQTPDGLFRPDDNISKAEAVAIIVSALNTGDLSVDQAKDALRCYADLKEIPDWLIIPAGKSEILSMTAKAPESANKFQPNRKISRAEVAVNLYNMREEAKLNPNAKLAEAMRLKTGEGYVIEGVTLDRNIATIPKGARIPVVLLNSLNSQKNEAGEVFITKADKNLVSKDKYLLVVQGANINGEITSVKPARYFIRNGKMVLDTKCINTTRGQQAEFLGKIDTNKAKKCWFLRVVNAIFKGSKVKLEEGKLVTIVLDKDIKVDVRNGWILE